MLAFRLASRELRGGLKDFRLFIACLAVGLSVIAAVGLLSARIEGGIREEAQALLGGDVEIGIVNARVTGEQLGFLKSWGRVSLTANLRAMATYGETATLIELKGVDDSYPLRGRVELDSKVGLSKALADKHIVIGPDLAARLKVQPGDMLTLGDAVFAVSDILRREPDHLASALSFGPRVVASLGDLEKTGLLMPGSIIHYNYHLLLERPEKLAAFRLALNQRFPHAPWIVKTAGESNRTVQGLVERLQLFLTLAGLSALLIGGVGILNATESYIAARAQTVATFKALGATRRTVLSVYVMTIAIVTLLGIVTSLFIGAILSGFLLPYLARFFPLSQSAGGDAWPLLRAAAFGILTVATFAVAALARGVEVKPAILFRGLDWGASASVPRSARLATLAATLLLVALVVASANDRPIALGFIGAAIGCFLLFAGASRLMAIAARQVNLPPGLLRLAVAGLARPAAPVFSIMLSVGIGMSVLVTLLLVEGNVERDIGEAIPAQTPTLFLIDIQPAERVAVGQFLAAKPYVSDVQSEPMVRGRIARVKGVPVEQAAIGPDVKWATQSDRGFSYAAAMPADTRLISGGWWPADYKGPPLVSLDRKVAQGMGLKVGDRISVNILGEEITATIASLRDINYLTLHINFALIFSPGTLERFTATHIDTLRVQDAGNEDRLIYEMAKAFPNVSAIRVRESLARLEEIIGHIADAIRLTALVALACGIIVLISTLAASLERRAYDSALFKTLGARRRDILLMFFTEWLMIAVVTGIIACVVGSLGAWAILKRLDWIAFHMLYSALAQAMLLVLLFILGAGLLLHGLAFALKPGAILRNE